MLLAHILFCKYSLHLPLNRQSMEAIADPTHERHTELLEWCGGDFDPQKFDIDAINRRLASLAPRKSTRRKTAKPASG
jgi:hypothetical protein